MSLPTGCVEKGEVPFKAAQRGLKEETGYRAEKWQSAGVFCVDGNKGCGRACFSLAQELEKSTSHLVYDMEESGTVFLSEPEIFEKISNGEILPLATVALVSLVASGGIVNEGFFPKRLDND